MGFSGISITSLLLILVIVLIIFGPKRLKNLGHELGGALKSFRKAVNNDEDKSDSNSKNNDDKADNDTHNS